MTHRSFFRHGLDGCASCNKSLTEFGGAISAQTRNNSRGRRSNHADLQVFQQVYIVLPGCRVANPCERRAWQDESQRGPLKCSTHGLLLLTLEHQRHMQHLYLLLTSAVAMPKHANGVMQYQFTGSKDILESHLRYVLVEPSRSMTFCYSHLSFTNLCVQLPCWAVSQHLLSSLHCFLSCESEPYVHGALRCFTFTNSVLAPSSRSP